MQEVSAIILEQLLSSFSDKSIGELKFLLNINGSNEDKLEIVKDLFASNKISIDGIDLVEQILNTLENLNLNNLNLSFDLSLARGLSYYTGTIIEVSSPDEFNIGSIGGGGRYDDLIQKNNPKLSGFGISFGFDRIFLILEELNLFPNEIDSSKSFLFLNFGTQKTDDLLNFVDQLRDKNIICELYPSNKKIKKQMEYANQRNIDYAILIGEDELKSNIFKLKDMSKGEESSHDLNDIISVLEKLN